MYSNKLKSLYIGVVCAVLCCVVFIISIVFFFDVREKDKVYYENQQRNILKLDEIKQKRMLDQVTSDLILIKQLPAFVAFVEKPDEINKKHLQDLFSKYSNSRQVYDQIRYLDENGMEVVRVNLVNGSPVVVADADLQNKKGRYYFDESFALNDGEIYMSPLDLNIEQNKIEEPFKPMLRVATPIVDAGNKRGILIVNYLAQEILDELNTDPGLSSEAIAPPELLNSDGYWLSSHDATREWAFMFEDKKNLTLASENPQLWHSIQSNAEGQVLLDDTLYTYTTLYPAGGRNLQWKLYRYISNDSIYAQSNRLGIELLIFNCLLMLSMSLVGYYVVVLIREKERSERLASDLEKFKLAVENASDHIVITDANGIVLYGNKMVEEITGYALTEAAGKKAGVLWRKPMDRHYYENLWKTIKIDKKPFVGTLTNRRKNGEAYEALISISPVLNNAGDVVYFVGIERDITKEKEIDRAKTEFVSLAAHQLKTPVGAFNWNLEMMIHGGYGPISDEQKEVLSDLYTMNKRMSDLITSLLNVSRIELGVFIIEPVPVDWIKLCDEVLVELDQRIRAKRHDVSKHYGEHVPTVLADPKLLRIIFQNFISNAVKYTKDAGRIHISITVKDETIVVSVANNGEPIPASEKDKIFDKLYRASNAQKQDPDGNGLGLYVVKEIVEHGGGKVWFESEEGKDTVFYCSFPLSGMVEKKGNINLS